MPTQAISRASATSRPARGARIEIIVRSKPDVRLVVAPRKGRED